MLRNEDDERGVIYRGCSIGTDGVRMTPRFDGDRVEMRGCQYGVLLAIVDPDTGDDQALFLTVDELERLASEGRRLHEEWAMSNEAVAKVETK